MKKIKPVHVKIDNFQSIKSIDFEINGFTCVTGKTNIGKSAIIRAISSALLGAPVVGNVRKGNKFCTVELKSEDWSLKWEKGEKGINKYWIPFNAETPLDKVGQKQIDQIADMGFKSIQVGSDSIQPWFADQFEPLFLLKKSGPAVTNFISEITRLSVLQDAITINVRAKKRLIDKSKAKIEDKKKLNDKLGKLSQLNSMNKLKIDLNHQSETIKESVVLYKNLKENYVKLEKTRALTSVFEKISEVKIPEDKLEKSFNSYSFLTESYKSLELEAIKVITFRGIKKLEIPKVEEIKKDVQTLKKLKSLQISIDSESEQINKYINIKKASIPEKISLDISKINKLKLSKKELESLNSEIKGLQLKEKTIKSELKEIEAEIGKIDLCPTCKRPNVSQHQHQ